jgi:hypothetical protein
MKTAKQSKTSKTSKTAKVVAKVPAGKAGKTVKAGKVPAVTAKGKARQPAKAGDKVKHAKHDPKDHHGKLLTGLQLVKDLKDACKVGDCYILQPKQLDPALVAEFNKLLRSIPGSWQFANLQIEPVIAKDQTIGKVTGKGSRAA